MNARLVAVTAFSEAERKIAMILKQLEIETGEVIDTVNLDNMDVTHLGSERREYIRQVRIETHRLPGSHWPD